MGRHCLQLRTAFYSGLSWSGFALRSPAAQVLGAVQHRVRGVDRVGREHEAARAGFAGEHGERRAERRSRRRGVCGAGTTDAWKTSAGGSCLRGVRSSRHVYYSALIPRQLLRICPQLLRIWGRVTGPEIASMQVGRRSGRASGLLPSGRASAGSADQLLHDEAPAPRGLGSDEEGQAGAHRERRDDGSLLVPPQPALV